MTQPALQTTGLWALWSANALPSPVFYKRDYLRGLAMRYTWQYLQPKATEFNFTQLRGIAKSAANAGKQISLNIICGVQTPTWLKVQRVANTPLPWDTKYLDALQVLIRALSKELEDYADILAHVKMCGGVNYTSGELHLPDEFVPLAVYTHDAVVLSTMRVAEIWYVNFPRCQLALPIQPQGLPRAGGDARNPTHTVVNLCKTRFPDRLALASHALHGEGWINPVVAEYAKSDGNTGYQMRNTMHDAAKLSAALAAAKSAGGRYVEVYRVDIENAKLQGVLSNAGF